MFRRAMHRTLMPRTRWTSHGHRSTKPLLTSKRLCTNVCVVEGAIRDLDSRIVKGRMRHGVYGREHVARLLAIANEKEDELREDEQMIVKNPNEVVAVFSCALIGWPFVAMTLLGVAVGDGELAALYGALSAPFVAGGLVCFNRAASPGLWQERFDTLQEIKDLLRQKHKDTPLDTEGNTCTIDASTVLPP